MKLKSYYYQDLLNFYQFNIPANQSILEIRNSEYSVLKYLKAKKKLCLSTPKQLNLAQKFNYIILPDSLNQLSDIQTVIHKLKNLVTSETRIILNYYNFLWSPIFFLAEKLGLKTKQPQGNWLSQQDIENLLALEDFEIIKSGKRFLFPIYLPVISKLFNKYLAHLPLINQLCLTNYIIARPLIKPSLIQQSVSLIIPARNEAGNIANIVKTLPKMGNHLELIFVEGHSKDNTYQAIKKVIKQYPHLDIKLIKQRGIGKGDAVRKGFDMAKSDILMIFDADLTVKPKELLKFYSAVVSGKGELVNGSRLVYPMEKQAMRALNIFGNKFFSLAFSWLLNQRIKDTLCGTKVISKKNYLKIAANRKYFGDFDPFGDFDLIFGAAKLNLKILEIPVKYQARKYGQTNISRFKHGWLLLKMTLFSLKKIKLI